MLNLGLILIKRNCLTFKLRYGTLNTEFGRVPGSQVLFMGDAYESWETGNAPDEEDGEDPAGDRQTVQ